MNVNRRFYLFSFVVLAILSAYPLINGVRMAYISITNGSIEPEQYAKYVVPYTAICVSILWYAALQPVWLKFKRLYFPVGMISAYGVFFAVEHFFETMQIHTTSMNLIEASTLAQGVPDSATVDVWQASLCIISPDMRGQSLTYSLTYEQRDNFFYVIGDNFYKIHYYLISLILITMVCGLLYGIVKMFRDNSRVQPIFLRGVSTAALLALCLFANTTAFFRQAAPIQTPLASILTGTFFVILGVAVGVYAGSYLMKKGKILAVIMPVLLAICATMLMYIGEAAMMKGNLYRFGTGWFFNGLPSIVLAPVDVFIVLLSGAFTGWILSVSRKREKQPGKRTMIAIITLCVAVAVTGPAISMAAPKITDDSILGCYVFDKNIYTSPLSSFRAYSGLPNIYGFDENSFIIADTETGDIQSYTAEYYKTPLSTDEFSSKMDGVFLSDWLPDLSHYKERYLLAVMYDQDVPQFGLYQMDSEIWLADIRGVGIKSIYRLVKTDTTTLSDLERAIEHGSSYSTALPAPSSAPSSTPSSTAYENQMTLKDVYTLARKGKELTLQDFEPFYYRLTGVDFTVRRYDVAGADTVFVHTGEGKLESALLMSRRTLDSSAVIDLSEGFEAVTQYMDPFNSFDDIRIDDPRGGEEIRELIYEYDYDQCRYYLNTKRGDSIYVNFESGEKMSLKQALEERRITIEDAVAHGLNNVFMIPVNNPLGGEFTVLSNLYTFSLNGETFYPSKSFMYVVREDDFSIYYDVDELTQFLELYGYDSEAKKLNQAISKTDIVSIARGNYVRDTILVEAGIESNIDWAYSPHTPVQFNIK